ncbi:hypothetical protein [Streptomyces sp. Root369]|uniref:hypothetical protein n=1 Tax=Streptomyces sp. Root369 TaxID=1736523 RepID=UPI00070AD552|nr:hypothetical protein [Streptomyces sp. Root369]KQW13570.1 hypothetical protein ASD08_30875 [Streptomyces sp. Root369]
MSTIVQQKDYWVTSPAIQPGGAYWLSWPISNSSNAVAMCNLTGIPADSNSGYYTMSVREVHVTTHSYWQGDLQFIDYYVGANFNNTGSKPITTWYTIRTLIVP